jgi:oligoribonuclease
LATNADNLIWIDLEMTGLDVNNDLIIEIATIVTDAKLNILGEGPDLVIHQSNEVLDKMDEWCQTQHKKSGLTQSVKNSRITTEEAETLTISFLKQYVPENTSPMCGNSICMDRRFLYRLMPNLEAFFHYRNCDVSTVKELYKRWTSNEYKKNEKDSAHRAMADIKESIDELKYYRDVFFRLN